MNIIIKTSDLKKSLQEVVGVVGKDLSMPILSHVLIQKNDKSIKITGTNIEVQITTSCKYIESDDFEDVTVPGKKLYEIVRSLNEQDIQLTTQKGKLALKTQSSSFKLATLPSNNFPTFEEFKPVESFTINQQQLLALLNKTSFSMATNPDVRFILCGLLIEITANTITAVSTDAHRLAISTTALEKKQINDISCILPRKAVHELIRVLQGNSESKVSIGNNQIRISFKGTTFTSKLMDGKFPAGYKRVIPTGAMIRATLDKQSIRSALQRVSILANEQFKGVRIEATSENMILSSENPEQEEAKETISYQTKTEDKEEIFAGFNSSYLIDAINACSGEDVVIGLNGSIKKDALKQEEKAEEENKQGKEAKKRVEGTLIYSPVDQNTKYVVMPYNI
jgi:DNA polymerase-3 subunit beta